MSGDILEELQMINDKLLVTNDILAHNYSAILFFFGVSGAIIVLLIFYKILKSFY